MLKESTGCSNDEAMDYIALAYEQVEWLDDHAKTGHADEKLDEIEGKLDAINKRIKQSQTKAAESGSGNSRLSRRKNSKQAKAKEIYVPADVAFTCPYCGSDDIEIIKQAQRGECITVKNRRSLIPGRKTVTIRERRKKVNPAKVGAAVLTAGLSIPFVGIKSEEKDTYYCYNCDKTFKV